VKESRHVSKAPKKFTPTLKPQEGLKLQIPYTPEGREFLDKLKALLGGKELPFVRTCPPTPISTSSGVAKSEAVSLTSHALDLRLEQEGWP
jgi:hypothetical protein